MKSAPPPKKYSLACWWLTYRVPVEREEIWIYEERAIQFARLTFGEMTVCKAMWPKPWERMKAKRAVRLAYLREHKEYPPDGWAPLPGDGRSRNVPINAQKRQYSAFLKRIAAMGR